MTLSRRAFLGAGAALAAAAGSSPLMAQPAAKAATPLRIAVSTYSYWHFHGERYPVERVIEDAARLGFDGVEILHRQMDDESPEYVARLKQTAFRHGMPLVMLSIHQDFVDPDPGARQKDVDHTIRCLELASRLGIPCIRLNSGRWNTIESFDDLMKVKGQEPPIAGLHRQGRLRVGRRRDPGVSAHRAAARRVMALENHWGLTTSVDTLLAIHKAVSSPWLGINLDTGNYPGDPYAGIAALAPHASIVQAKTYHGGGEWYTLDLDYVRIARILRENGFGGWVSLEMEGKEPPETAVPKSLDLLRRAFGDARGV